MSKTLGRLLMDQADLRPDAPALVDVGRTWSFAEAAGDAGRIAQALRSLGVAAGDRVGVHLNKSGEGTIAMHGVVQTGAIAVPLDPTSPASRLARICSYMEIDVIVSHEPRRAGVAELQAFQPVRAVVGLDSDLDGMAAVTSAELSDLAPTSPADVRAEDRAYIITTSGSTGEPKGILHSHASALAWVDNTNAAFGVTAEDRIADIAPHHFDISTLALWSAPRAGAASIVMPEGYQRLPASHSQRLADEAVSVWYSVPFLLQQLVTRGDLENRDLSALRWVWFGGEAVPPNVVAKFTRLVPNAHLANIYGPAEINTTTYHVFETAIDESVPLPIGQPWDGTELRVVEPGVDSPDLAHVVDTGELWVTATTMMEGYWGRDGLDVRAIVEVDGRRWYRTGDLVSSDDAGVLTFLGRVDHQVKIRGHRTELEGIEAELESIDGVDNVVVTVDRTGDGEDHLIAGVLGTRPDFDEVEFLSAARRLLPTYAVPTRIVVVHSHSTTGSGKLDRRTLRSGVLDLLEKP